MINVFAAVTHILCGRMKRWRGAPGRTYTHCRGQGGQEGVADVACADNAEETAQNTKRWNQITTTDRANGYCHNDRSLMYSISSG